MPEHRHASNQTARTEPVDGGTPDTKSELDPLIGRVINGRFKIVSVIARGGMGKVYKAEQAPLGRVCALKVLSPKYEGDRDPEFHKRFFLEASTSAKLTHANTVTIFDYGKDGDDLYYIAMEYIEGRTLHRALREDGPFDDLRTAHVAGQICRSLREAHGLGVVHRDLKPGNILLMDRADERDIVKVLDFGLVKDVSGQGEDLTQAGLFMGSPKYMAPEQILGGEVSPRTDVYSLGVMMFEMLTGKVPFDRGASVGTLMAQVNDPIPPLRSMNPLLQASPTMENIVFRCLEKEPDRRFNSMKDLLAALKRIGSPDGVLTDTTENMPAARMDKLRSTTSSDTMPAVRPDALRSSTSSDSLAAAQLGGSGPLPSGDSLSLHATSPADTDMAAVRGPVKGRTFVWGGVGIAVALAISLAVVMFSSPKHGPITDTAATTTVAAVVPASTGAVATQAPATTATSALAAPQIRLVRVESDPKGAGVAENDVQLCTTTPCDVIWKDADAHTLVLTRPGYKTAKATVGPKDDKVTVKLDVIPYVPRQPVQTGSSSAGGPYKKSPYGD